MTLIKLINMKSKKYAAILLIYIIVVGNFFKDQIYGESIGMTTVIYFIILIVLSLLFIKNSNVVQPKRLKIYLSVYFFIVIGITLYFFFKPI